MPPVSSPTTVPDTSVPPPSSGGGSDLEALIPDEVDGITMTKTSLTGQQFLDLQSGGNEQVAQDFSDFLAGLGGSINDLSAVGSSGFGESDSVYVNAIRLAGADGAALRNGMVQQALDSIPVFNSGMTGAATSMTLGGKNVTLVTATLGGSVYEEQYFYAYDDIVFVVYGGSEDVVAEALSLLP